MLCCFSSADFGCGADRGPAAIWSIVSGPPKPATQPTSAAKTSSKSELDVPFCADRTWDLAWDAMGWPDAARGPSRQVAPSTACRDWVEPGRDLAPSSGPSWPIPGPSSVDSGPDSVETGRPVQSCPIPGQLGSVPGADVGGLRAKSVVAIARAPAKWTPAPSVGGTAEHRAPFGRLAG